MWSRLSLRVQIVIILALVLGAEALASSAWLLWVLPRSYVAAEHQYVDAAAQWVQDACGPQPTAGCAEAQLARGAADHPDEHRRAAEIFQFHLANVLVVALALLILGAVLFNRAVARPVEKLSAVADRIGHLELDELGGGLESPMLGQLTASFERMARALKREQQRVGEQISELTRMNKELAGARDAIVRQEKLATVGRLAAGVAHEVGNPLGGILGYAELLKLKGDAHGKEYGERIAKEVERIDRTVRGLLDFSRPSQTALAPIDLAACIQRSLALCQADKRFREVQPQLELPADLPQVMADEHRLAQVLVNLLLNAGDAMGGKGEVSLRARATSDAQPHRRASDPPPGRRVELWVEDTGPGIPPEALPRIFDPFFTTKDVGHGTGLGLSIAASIIEAFGGELRAENRAEGGARFVATLRAA